MVELNKNLRKLKIISFFLFLIPTLGLILSLLFNNFLTSFDYKKPHLYQTITNNLESISCEDIDTNCTIYADTLSEDFFDCFPNEIIRVFLYDGKILTYDDINKLTSFSREKLKAIDLKEGKSKNKYCIKNSELFLFYNSFPGIFYSINKLKESKNFSLGTNKAVNPFIYGEVSISNIVKRFPVNYLFKPLMYITTILIFIYWYLNNTLAKKILTKEKNFKFFYFGILSGILLAIHVYFLGTNIDNSLIKSLRRLIIVLFILFEMISQVLLVINFRKNIKKFNYFINIKILNIKYCLIGLLVLSTILILFILSIYDLTSSFDYIIEWNYFQVLLFFYLLSSLLWKNLILNPSSS